MTWKPFATLICSALLAAACNSNPNTGATEPTPAPQPAPEEKPAPTVKEIPSYSTVQVVTEERFWDEVCEWDGSRYGFKTRTPAVIDFYADWCGPCGKISPYLAEFAEKYAGQLAIYKVNVDKCPNVAQVFKVESIPTLIFLKPNEQPMMLVGAPEKADLEEKIKALL